MKRIASIIMIIVIICGVFILNRCNASAECIFNDTIRIAECGYAPIESKRCISEVCCDSNVVRTTSYITVQKKLPRSFGDILFVMKDACGMKTGPPTLDSTH